MRIRSTLPALATTLATLLACGDGDKRVELDARPPDLDAAAVDATAPDGAPADADGTTPDAATADASVVDAVPSDGPSVDASVVDAPSPATSWLTYLGGADADVIRDVAVDAAGNLIVVGGTKSTNFPTTPGAYDRTFDSSAGGQLGSGGRMDAFVAKLDGAGHLLWSTYLGGPSYDRAYAVEVDAAGDIYVAGRAGAGFPTTPGTVQPAFAGDVVANGLYGPQDGFIAKLSSDGSRLLWSTYFGGTGRDFIRDLDLDATGVYVGVAAVSRAHPHVTAGAYDTTLGGSYDVVAAKVALDGTRVLWGTYLGGSGDDGAPAVRAPGDGSLVLVSASNSTDLATTTGALQRTLGGGTDLMLTRIQPGGGGLAYLTYLGGAGNETQETHQLALAANGDAIVVCPTTSAALPTSPGAVQPARHGTLSAYVARVAGGSRVVSATYLGGATTTAAQGIAVDDRDRVIFGGPTSSPDLPTTATAFAATLGGGTDGFVARLSVDLTTIEYLSYLGGSGDDEQRSLWIIGGDAVSVGQTTSADLPATTGVAQPTYRGLQDAYVARLRLP